MVKRNKKVPKTRPTNFEHRPKVGYNQTNPYPSWKFNIMDTGGKWGWKRFRVSTNKLFEIREKLSGIEKNSWHEIEGKENHFIKIDQIISGARKRLTELKLDDIDQLFSIRLSGKERVWGIREGSVFKVLWWDPRHEVCPSQKKHT